MKIVCISASKIPSSTANSIEVMKVCQALVQLGHRVHLLVPGHKSVAWDILARYYGLQEKFDLEWLPAAARMKRYDFSLFAVRRALALVADAAYVWPPQVAVMALAAGLPVLLELHDRPEGKLGPHVFWIFLMQKGKKRLLPITQALASHIEFVFGSRLAPDEMVVTPNGVDLERYADLPDPAEARSRLGLAEKLTAGYTGHMYEGRGMGLLKELARRHPRIQFLWVGGRPEDVEMWRGRLAVEKIDNVVLTGFVENSRLPLYQAAADLLLMPYERTIAGSSGGNSADYCSPMKMFEYLACGRAILSSDLPVIREVLNVTNAVLCQPEDLEAWDEAFSQLLNDPERRRRLGEQARSDIENYTWVARARRSLAGFLDESSP